MTDTKLLKERIARSGLKMSFIAERMGLSRTGLYNKINNRRPFNQYEIEAMCQVLQIVSLDEKEAIFFAGKVDNLVNKLGGD